MAMNSGLIRTLLSSGIALSFVVGCSDSIVNSTFIPAESETVPAFEVASVDSDQSVTLFFDGDTTVFTRNDLLVSISLFLKPTATIPEIQDIAESISGIRIPGSDIAGSGVDPIILFDFNGDGIRGDIRDLGIALAAFLGQTTPQGINTFCLDVLLLDCGVTLDSPIPVIAPAPAPVIIVPTTVTFEAGTTPGDVELVKVEPGEAPIDGNLVLLFSTTDTDFEFDGGESEITLTFPQGSAIPQDLRIFRALQSQLNGSGIIQVSVDPSSTAANFPVGTINLTIQVDL